MQLAFFSLAFCGLKERNQQAIHLRPQELKKKLPKRYLRYIWRKIFISTNLLCFFLILRDVRILVKTKHFRMGNERKVPDVIEVGLIIPLHRRVIGATVRESEKGGILLIVRKLYNGFVVQWRTERRR